jgi:hypothetical protein
MLPKRGCLTIKKLWQGPLPRGRTMAFFCIIIFTSFTIRRTSPPTSSLISLYLGFKASRLDQVIVISDSDSYISAHTKEMTQKANFTVICKIDCTVFLSKKVVTGSHQGRPPSAQPIICICLKWSGPRPTPTRYTR